METLKEIFVSKEIAQKLKAIGFNEPCMAYYLDNETYNELYATNIETDDGFALLEDTLAIDNHNYEDEAPFLNSAPTYEQVLKWFRDKEIESSIVVINEIMYDDYNFGYGYHIVDFRGRTVGNDYGFIEHFETYEEAREQLILKLIEIYEKGK